MRRSDKSQTSRSDISFDKELEDSSRTEERQNKLDQKGLNSSPSKNILSKPNIPPPKSPKNMTPKNNNEKNLKNLEKSSERPQKKIFEPVTEPNSEKKNVDNMIPSRNDKKIIKTNNNTIEKDKNNNFNPKLQSNDLKKTASPAKKKIFEPPLKKQEEIPQKSSFKTTTEQIKPNELNPNMKPPEKTKLMNFDDDDDKEAEEEKLPNFGFQGSHSNIREPVESNKFSFAKKAEPIKKIENNDDDEDDDEDDKPIMLQTFQPKNDSTSKTRSVIENDKELEYLDKILNLEKSLGKKNEQISELMKKIEEMKKSNEELKQIAYRANKDGQSTSKTLQADYDKIKFSLKDSEEKRLTLQEESRQLALKFKKMEMDYKNVMSDYQAIVTEQKQKEENFYDLQGQKDTIESTNKSYSLELKSHKDKITNLSSEISRLRDEQKRSSDENCQLQQKIDSMQFQLDSNIKELDKMKSQSQSFSSSNENTYKELHSKNEILIKDLRNHVRIAEGQKEEALSSQTKLALELQKMKIEKEQLKVRLESRLQDINTNDQSLMEKSAFFEKENMNLKKKLIGLQKELNMEKEEQGAMIEQLQEDLKKTRNELFDTERAKKELESELISLSNRGSRAGEINEGIDGLKLNFDKQMKILKKQLESKDIRLREKEEEFKKLEEEYSEAQLQIKKLDFSKSRSSYAFEALTDENLKQKNEELELKLLNKEEEYMDRIETLQKEIEALKMQAISGQTNMKPSIKGNAGDEMEVAALSVENQKLRKALKDLQNKGGSNSARGGMMEDNVLLRENEMLRKKNKEIEFERQKAADELINLKMNSANYDNNKELNSKVLTKYTEQIKMLETSLKSMETELVKSKQRIGDAINAAMDIGGADLVDKITSVMK